MKKYLWKVAAATAITAFPTQQAFAWDDVTDSLGAEIDRKIVGLEVATPYVPLSAKCLKKNREILDDIADAVKIPVVDAIAGVAGPFIKGCAEEEVTEGRGSLTINEPIFHSGLIYKKILSDPVSGQEGNAYSAEYTVRYGVEGWAQSRTSNSNDSTEISPGDFKMTSISGFIEIQMIASNSKSWTADVSSSGFSPNGPAKAFVEQYVVRKLEAPLKKAISSAIGQDVVYINFK